MKLKELQKKYPQFIYDKYNYKIKGENLEISFVFEIKSDNEPKILFKPKIVIKNIGMSDLPTNLKNLIFHLGLIEMISCWKATCSPEIIIKAGYLDKKQIKWWQDLIAKGMGQFFYENKIGFQKPRFVFPEQKIKSPITLKTQTKRNVEEETKFSSPLKNRYLIPFAGGRDSIVTLEKFIHQNSTGGLKKRKKEIALFLVNPIPQIQKCAKVSKIKKQIIIKREIDKKLLELNQKGYLNGHTPFTALLSFLSVLCATLFDYKNIVFSNEKSANEGNVKYLGKIINHQWSKSSEFEKKFKGYCKKYLVKNINYYSFLRRYTELKITKIFAGYPQYFSVFCSCNAGMKIKSSTKDAWCRKCPKCLFVYTTLYPFLEKKQILKIFGQDLFTNKKLLPVMKALIGETKSKPFECVGTYKESKMAFNLCLKKAKKSGKIPYLLTNFKKAI